MSAVRYLALVDTRQQAPAPPPGLECTFQAGGLEVWSTPETISLGPGGIVIGHLFSRSLPSRRIRSLSEAEQRRIGHTSGECLLTDYWGGYVALLRTPGDETLILRDPSGALPAFWRSWHGGIAIAACVGEAPFSPGDGIRVDTEALLLHLWSLQFAGHRTCLRGIREILPGEALLSRGGTQRSVAAWRPWNALRPRRRPAISPGELRALIVDTVGRWGACFERPLVSFSGGLDSTIVCAALACSAAAPHGLTMFGPDPDGDERSFARAAAAALGMSWDEIAYDLADIDIARPVLAQTPRPLLVHYGQAMAAAQDLTARRVAADAFFTGNGGDNVFCLMRSVTPLVDRIRAGAKPRELRQTFGDIALLTGADAGTILRSLARRLLRPRANPGLQGDDSFLSRQRVAQARAASDPHPWLCPPSNLEPGQRAHMRMLRRAYGADGGLSRATHPPSIAPLLSQPFVEACLNIPTWEWVRGGRDRSAVRNAFRGLIPDDVLFRKSKGGPSGFVDAIFRRHEADIVSRLRNGMLVEAGVIEDVATADDAILHRGRNPLLSHRLLAFAAAEAWARYWGC